MARKRTKTDKTAATPPLTEIPAPRFEVVPLDKIVASPFNRRTFEPDDPEDAALVANLKATRQFLEPLVLRANPEGDGFRLIAGERRVHCGRLAGLAEAPAQIYDVDDVTANLMTFTENHHRKDLDLTQAFILSMRAQMLSPDPVASPPGGALPQSLEMEIAQVASEAGRAASRLTHTMLRLLARGDDSAR